MYYHSLCKYTKMIVLILVLGNILFCSAHYPFTEIPQGPLRGQFLKSASNRLFSSFTGIPYAEPPVGKLRFELVKPATKWNGTLNATKAHSMCPQIDVLKENSSVEGSEDCLYLNVYTPQLDFSNVTKLLPVIVYIHGGGFSIGHANFYLNNPKFLMNKDIVLITPNYRLGPLGFFVTEDDLVPGNNGLKDQSLAIRWAKENAAYFGGDPNKITVCGESAGAASAHLHMLSPLSRDLISAVIAQSGTALNYWLLPPSNNRQAELGRKLATALNCSTATTKEMMDCLKTADFREITRLQHSFYIWRSDPTIPFRVVIEKDSPTAFLSEPPSDIIRSGKAAKVPLLTGVNTEEGAMRSPEFFANPDMLQELNERFETIAPIIFLYDNIALDKNYTSRKIREFYFDNQTITNCSKSELTNAFTDSWFLSGVTNALWLHLNYTDQPVYYYAFGHRGNFSFATVNSNDSFNYGVSHVDELLYLFSFEEVYPEYKPSDADRNVTNLMTTLWTNFATFGNPTPASDATITEQWTPVNSENLEYYSIKSHARMDEKLYWNRVEFWKRLPLIKP